jgi:hypothetical protein
MNQNKAESQLDFRDINALKSEWKGDNIKWMSVTGNGSITDNGSNDFPLWKLCVILALIMLAAETFLLARPKAVAVA